MALNIGSSTIGGDSTTVKQITEAIRIDLIEAAKEVANTNLDALVDKVDTMWVGVTADQFKEKIKADKKKFGQIMDLLYEEVEQDIKQMEANVVNADSYVAANMGDNGGGGGTGSSGHGPSAPTAPTTPTQPEQPSAPEQPTQPQQPSTPPSEDDILKIISDEPTEEPGTQDGGVTPGGGSGEPQLPDDFEERYKKDIEDMMGGGEDTKPGTGESEPGNPAPTEEEKKAAEEEAAKKAAEEEAAKKAEEEKKKAEEEQKAKEEEERKAKEEEERKAKEEEERKAKEEEERKAKEEEERKAKEEEEKKKAEEEAKKKEEEEAAKKAEEEAAKKAAEEEAAKKAAEEEAAKKAAEEEAAKKAAEEEAAKKAEEEAAQLQPVETPGLTSPGEIVGEHSPGTTDTTYAAPAYNLDKNSLEYKELVATIYAEATENPSYMVSDTMGVTSIILNRVEAGNWGGSTIHDVISSGGGAGKGQFHGYGQGNSKFDRAMADINNVPAEMRNAIDRVLAGERNTTGYSFAGHTSYNSFR